MDPEQTFLRVHARMSCMLSRLLTPRIRSSLEFIFFVVAVALFCLLVVMHTNFVQQPGCSSEFSGVDIEEAHIVQIKISSAGLWLQNAVDHNVMGTPEQRRLTESLKVPNVDGGRWMSLASKFWISLGARWSKLMLKSWNNYKKLLVPQVESTTYSSSRKPVVDETKIKVDTVATHVGLPKSARESFRATVIHLFREWRMHFSSFLINAKHFSGNVSILWNTAGSDRLLDIPKWLHMFHMERLSSFIVKWMEKRSKAFEPTYLYTVEKGYFLLPEEAKSRHNVLIVNITISARHPCFGNRWQQLLINSFVGYDTILMNSLLSSPGQGYLYNFHTKEFYDLSYAHKLKENFLASVADMITTKCSVLIMSLFVFFTTTMSVSFTLRETQSRMVKFTVQLQHHARDRLPTFQLIFAHVIEFLVFVPIMIGILFFLFEFYDDQLLAFLVLTLVWLCELFMLISVRTPISMQFFPRFFFLYFLIFHVYFFSYAYGFSYLAFSSTAAFMHHSILYFWNRYEVPALERFIRSRSPLQQQSGVHITSTILTSTLHIARVNVRNPGLGNNEFGSGPWPRSETNQSRPSDFVEGVEFSGSIEEPSAANNQIQ